VISATGAYTVVMATFTHHVDGTEFPLYRFGGRFLRLAAAGGFFWLIILFMLTLSDYFTRTT